MKKFLLKATLVAIFAVAMATASLFAQCPPTPDCHSNSFIYGGELTILIQSPNNPNLIVLGEKISPCNVATLPATCWNVLTFCWEGLSPTEKAIKVVSNNSGAPSTSVCPPTFTPTDAIQQLTTVNCNSLCE